MYLVLIETSGNQNYIFATNKLRENVGASELTYRVGTEWLLEAVHEAGGPQLWSGNPTQFRENLLKQRSIQESDVLVEVIVATSGKALLLVKDRQVGQDIVRRLTTRTLKEAPGLDVCGVISDKFQWGQDGLGTVNRKVHERFEEVRAGRPGPALRFLRLPMVDECQTSGMPAQFLDNQRAGKPAPRSKISDCKWQAELLADERLQILLARAPNLAAFGAVFAENINWLEDKCEWLAVVHADGNGLGEIFLDFGKYANCNEASQNASYVEKFRRFSIALDICTEKAFLHAAERMVNRRSDNSFTFPILPLVLGGDDLTVVCDGKDALQFTYDFLTEFERQSEQPQAMTGNIIPEVAGQAFTPQRLSACAGIAIIKPHFPFAAAYDLAEELIVSAKRVKKLITDPNKTDDKYPDVKTLWPCSSIDFHALYDSSGSELDTIRRKLRYRAKQSGQLDCEMRNYARPYVVTPTNDLKDAEGVKWAELHHWDQLTEQVKAILAPEKDSSGQETGRRNLPNNQLHELRAGLPLGKEIADGRFRLIKQRYDLSLFQGETNDTLYRNEPVDKAEERDEGGNKIEITTEFTALLDAMDAANFWREEDAKRSNTQTA